MSSRWINIESPLYQCCVLSGKILQNRFCWMSEVQRLIKTIWAKTWGNVPSDMWDHTRSVIRVFVVHMKKLCILSYPKCAQWKFWLYCANAQVVLNLRWAHMSKDTFSEVTGYFLTKSLKYWSIESLQKHVFGYLLSSRKVQLYNFLWYLLDILVYYAAKGTFKHSKRKGPAQARV